MMGRKIFLLPQNEILSFLQNDIFSGIGLDEMQKWSCPVPRSPIFISFPVPGENIKCGFW